MAVKKKRDISEEKMRIISKGADVKSSVDIDVDTEFTTVCLRITRKLLSEVDSQVKKRLSVRRMTWLMEAIQEKLKRDMSH